MVKATAARVSRLSKKWREVKNFRAGVGRKCLADETAIPAGFENQRQTKTPSKKGRIQRTRGCWNSGIGIFFGSGFFNEAADDSYRARAGIGWWFLSCKFSRVSNACEPGEFLKLLGREIIDSADEGEELG